MQQIVHFLFFNLFILQFLISGAQSNEITLLPDEHNDVEQCATELINSLPPAGYNKNSRPNFGGEPVLVNVSLVINDISAISETTMKYKIDFYIRHYWHDHRLAFSASNHMVEITLPEDFIGNIWKPDTFFVNGESHRIHETIARERTILLRIGSRGDILYSTRVILTASCSVNLDYFPHDQQQCTIEIASYGLTYREMIYRWSNESSFKLNLRNNLPTFYLRGYDQQETTRNFSTGNFSILICELFFARSISYYVVHIYFPSFLIVVMSWVPFWLDPHDNHTRVTLSVITMLTITTLITSVTNLDFPKISHLKAIDIYLFVSFVYVFISLLQNSITAKRGKETTETQRLYPVLADSSIIDRLASYIIPLSFLAFNLIYAIGLWLLVAEDRKREYIKIKL